jgi:NHLM bacteriocin system ABC transporter ATP-binding protein
MSATTEELPASYQADLKVFLGLGSEQISESHTPFLLDHEDCAWFISNGNYDIFAVEVIDGKPYGQREHFMSLQAGELIFGINPGDLASGSGFLAVGSTGARVIQVQLGSMLDAFSGAPSGRSQLASLIDNWVMRLSEGVTRNYPGRPKPTELAIPDERISLSPSGVASTRKGVAWIEAPSSSLVFLGTEELLFSYEPTCFPLAPYHWVENYETLDLPVHDTLTVLATGHAVIGLQALHSAVCEAEFVNKRLVAVDEYNRLKTKAEYQQAARESALAEIASVLDKSYADYVDARGGTEGDPLLVACRLVGAALGIHIKEHPGLKGGMDMAERLSAVAKASRFRFRDIALRDIWWKQDSGAILAFREAGEGEEEQPIALIPTSPRSYQAINGATGQMTSRVDAAFARSLHPIAKAFYRPLPDGKINGIKLIRFGARGLSKEFLTIALMGILVGVLGLATPFFTGQIFDSVIPSADRPFLFQMVAGLIAAAFGKVLFEVTRAVAVLRIEGKMDYGVQSALWDRLLSLPLNFFRKYSAGDLADRAYGIDRIRELVSGAGVAAILGAVTSIFYIFQMFNYSQPLAFTGLGLVALAMVYTIVLNLFQLSHQRHLYGVVGRVTSIVLQFISGVSKIRVAGAEDHAFKVWAHHFSRQRQISWVVGRIQNGLQVFTTGFPVFASLCLFYVLHSTQQAALAEGTPSSITTGDFVAFNTAFGIFLSSMLALASSSLQIFQTLPVYERFKPILVAEPEVDEAKSYPGELSGEIEVYHVNFRYTDDGPMILRNVSLKIKPGEFVAFVGPSGSGKSTLLRLLLGFESPESGKIYYDGQDLGSLDLREVRQQIGVVLQTSRLMPTDIYRNIIGNRSLTMEQAWDAARAAGLDIDIKAMPMGMHTVVAEGSGGFSGGQKQRLMIARAVVHKPRMLYLDEATSALDNRSQAIVTESMDKLQATRIVVAHRLSTIRNADKIVVLVAGRVEEMGTYEELMSLNGHFADLANRQIA